MKYSIIMPYYRKQTLHNTLVSYVHHYGHRKDFEIIIMEDYKNIADKDEHKALLDIINTFSLQIVIRLVPTYFKDCFAPSKLFNTAADIAGGTWYVLTNPECFHITDVLGQFDKELTKAPEAYIVSACYSTDTVKKINKFHEFKPEQKIWLQHSKHLNRGLHWCSVIHKNVYQWIGGFDEQYATGFGREDVDFVRMLKKAKVHIVTRDDVIVVHMDHPPCSPNKKALWERNKKYFDKKWGIK